MGTITAPDALQPRARKKLERDITELVCQSDPVITLGSRKRSNYCKEVRAALSTYSNATLYRLQHAATKKKTSFGLFSLLSNSAPQEDFLNDWCVLYPTISQFIHNKGLKRHINAFPFYEHLEPQDAGHYPDKRAIQATSIIRVTEHLKRHNVSIKAVDPANADKSIDYIKDRKLRDLITTNDDPCRLADIIIERKLTTAAQVKDLIDTMRSLPTSLTEGAL